jgi:copper oxidase (laccase) domain-containing protein
MKSLSTIPFETFPALDALPRVRAVFLQRVPGLDVKTDRETALQRLVGIQREALDALGFAEMRLAKASQIHSAKVKRISGSDTFPVPDCDALVTTESNLCLGIYVADCAAVFVADRHGRGIALAHSGRKGTELGIVPKTIAALCEATGADAQDLIVQISPCIRPPNYEVDFAAEILSQAAEAGVREIHDCGTCTASDLQKYYSYRKEQGQTGRLLAALALKEF